MEPTATHATAIEQLYHAYHQPLHRYLAHLVHDSATAEDLCHETFIKVLRHREHLDTLTNVSGWLFCIAKHTAYDHLRQQRRGRTTTLTDTHATQLATPAMGMLPDAAEPVWQALRRLPEHERIPLVLQSWAGYSLEEIASVLGCTVTTIKSRMHRARVHFRQVYVA